VTALSSISVSAAFDRTFILEGGAPSQISPKLINDWYPEKVNQAFSRKVVTQAYVTELLFAGIGNRGCLPPRQNIKAMVDHCNPGTALPRNFLSKAKPRTALV
jgi:hypothetical protein